MNLFFINEIFKLKTSLEAFFYDVFLYFNRSFGYSENKIKELMIDHYIPSLHNVIKSFKKTFNSKHRAKLKIDSQIYKNTKN